MNTTPPLKTDSAPPLRLQMRLQAWLSPAFPVGAFTYSGGLEAAVDAGEVADADSLKAWLFCYLEDGPGRSDAILLAQCCKGAAAQDWTALQEAAELAAVFSPSAERRLETRAQGGAFLKAARAAHPWPDPEAQSRAEAILGEQPAYSAVFGAWSGGFGAAAGWAAPLFLHALASNLISAGQRLGALGQTEGQALLSDVSPLCLSLGREAGEAGLEEIGGAMMRGDLASMRHETQKVRLFRS